MGLLDDAIREHLELKRRRGADPAEIERAEREALGPVRRGPEEVRPEELADEFAAETGAVGTGVANKYGSADKEYWEAEPFEDADTPYRAEAPLADELGPAPLQPVEPFLEPDRPAPPEPVDPPPSDVAFDLAPFEAPSGTTSDERLPPAGRGEDTVEYRLEDHAELAADRERGGQPREGEDVLEETPEFLQDAPEHDRLWFEQRPPRDFDFDD